MKIDDLLNLTTMDFFDIVRDEEITKPDMIKYIKSNFGSDLELLSAFRKEAKSYKEYYDHEFNEEYYDQQMIILKKQIDECKETTIPHYYMPEAGVVMNEIHKIENFKDLPLKEKQIINKHVREKILEENPGTKKILMLDIKYPYNWDTHRIGDLIGLLEEEIQNVGYNKKSACDIIGEYLVVLRKYLFKEINDEELISRDFDKMKLRSKVFSLSADELHLFSKTIAHDIVSWSYDLISRIDFFPESTEEKIKIKDELIGEKQYTFIVNEDGSILREYFESLISSLLRAIQSNCKIKDYDFNSDLLSELRLYKNSGYHPPVWFSDVTSDVSQESTQGRSSFRIANGKKTDFAKIVSAMYDLRMFETSDGKIASNKQKLFDVLGKVFNEDFSSYSTLLNRAKQSVSYTDIFDKLKNKAQEYDDK